MEGEEKKRKKKDKKQKKTKKKTKKKKGNINFFKVRYRVSVFVFLVCFYVLYVHTFVYICCFTNTYTQCLPVYFYYFLLFKQFLFTQALVDIDD